jgi:hypothetical protein
MWQRLPRGIAIAQQAAKGEAESDPHRPSARP